MHYLKDYLELLEPLRELMREKFTLMRENDLKLQVEFTQLEEDSSEFLNNYRLYQNQSSLSPTKSKINMHRLTTPINDQSFELTPEQYIAQQQKQIEYDKLIERHEQLLKMTTTKMNLANESHEFVERYYKKLENDLNKFKMELEADYSGLTEILENRFASEGCNEYNDKTGETSIFDLSLLDMENLFDSFDDLTKPKSMAGDYTNQLSLNYLPSPTRRLPAGLTSCNSSFNRKSHQRLHSNPLTSSRGRKRLQSASSTNNIGKRKRSIVPNSFLTDSHYFHQSDDDDESSTNRYFSLKNSTFDDEENHEEFDSSNVLSSLNEQTTGTMDEQRYCFCNQISYGDMIACDNPTCRREWFHYSCVGIITPPKGKWFCNECT